MDTPTTIRLIKSKQLKLREAATLAARIALRVAKEENWPVSHRDAQAVAELMDGPDQQVAREIYDRLDALYEQA